MQAPGFWASLDCGHLWQKVSEEKIFAHVSLTLTEEHYKLDQPFEIFELVKNGLRQRWPGQ